MIDDQMLLTLPNDVIIKKMFLLIALSLPRSSTLRNLRKAATFGALTYSMCIRDIYRNGEFSKLKEILIMDERVIRNAASSLIQDGSYDGLEVWEGFQKQVDCDISA